MYLYTPDYWSDYIAHHGIQGQKWGVRNGPPYPLSLQKTSEKIYNSAEKRISKITKDVQMAAKKSNSKLYGLENRLKTKESISRKLDKNSKEKKIIVFSFEYCLTFQNR